MSRTLVRFACVRPLSHDVVVNVKKAFLEGIKLIDRKNMKQETYITLNYLVSLCLEIFYTELQSLNFHHLLGHWLQLLTS